MATRYWVGGSGTWNSSNTTNWSATSGGAGGASAPTFADNVIFDANSGTGADTVTATGSVAQCAGFKYDAAALIVITGGAVAVYGTFETYRNSSTALSTLDVSLYGSSITMALNSYVSWLIILAAPATATGNIYAKNITISAPYTLDLNSNSLTTNNTTINGTISNGSVYFSGLNASYNSLLIDGVWSSVTVYVQASTYQPSIYVTAGTLSNLGDLVVNYTGTSTISTLVAKNITINAGTLTASSWIISAYGSFYLAPSATLSTTSSSTVNFIKVSGSPTVTRTLRVEGTLTPTGKITFNINAGTDTTNVTGANFGSSTYTVNTLSVQSAANFTCANVHTRTFSVYATVACDISALSGVYTSNFSNSSISLLPGTCTLYFKNYAGYGTAFFTAGVVTYNAVTVADVIPLQFTGAAVMNTLTCSTTLGQGTGRGLLFDPGYVYTVNTTFTLSGASSSDRVSLSVTSGTTPATISKSSGIVTAAYANISYSTATGGATFNAPLITNTNNGGNSGWNFIAAGNGNFFSFF